MSDPQKDNDRKAGDELVRRLLKTPPDPKKASGKRKVPPKIKTQQRAPKTGDKR